MAGSREKEIEPESTSTTVEHEASGSSLDASLRTRVYVSDAVLSSLDEPLAEEEVASIRIVVDNVPTALAGVQASLQSSLLREFGKTDVGALYNKVISTTSQKNAEGKNPTTGSNLTDAIIAAAAGSAVVTVQDLGELVMSSIGVPIDELKSSVTNLLMVFDVAVGELKQSYLSYVNSMSDLENVTARDVLEREIAAYETITRDVASRLHTKVLARMGSTFTQIPDVLRDTFVNVLDVLLEDQRSKSLIHSGGGVEALEFTDGSSKGSEVLFRASAERVLEAAQIHAADELRIQLEVYTITALLDYFRGSKSSTFTIYVSSILNVTPNGSLGNVTIGLRERLTAFEGLTSEEAEAIVKKVEQGDLEEVLRLLYDDQASGPVTPLEIEWNGLRFTRQDPTRQDGWRSVKDGGISIWYSVDPLTGRSDSETCYLLETLERDGCTYYALRPISTFGGIVTGGVQFGN